MLFCFLLRCIEPVAFDAYSPLGSCELDGIKSIAAMTHDGLFYSDAGRDEIDCLTYLYSVDWRFPFHAFSVEHAVSIIK